MMKENSALYDFFGKIAIAQTINEYESALVPYCADLFSVQSILAMEFHRSGHANILFRWIPDDRLRNFFDKNYLKLGFILDPFYEKALSVKDWSAHSLREVAPDRFESSDYYNTYFGATKMVDEMSFVARVIEDTSVTLSMGRNHGQKKLRMGEVNNFKLFSKTLAPKLRQIVLNQPPRQSAETASLEQRFFMLSQLRETNISIREAQVAALIVRGHSSRAIGLNLGISRHTVKVHRRALYRKLAISSQNELFGLLAEYAELQL